VPYHVESEFQGHFVAPRTATRYLVVHHAAASYAQQLGINDVRSIRNYHVNHHGWAGIGYHEVLAEETQNGLVGCYIVSNPLTMRAHTWGRNHEAFGICMAADFSQGIPAQKWIDALSLRLVEAKRRWPAAQIVGHRDITLPGHGTACPGTMWATWKPALLRQVEVMLGQQPPTAPDPFARWGPIGKPSGAAVRFAVPRAWLVNQILGACVAPETYSASGKYSITEFAQGYIVYLKTRNTTIVEMF
jgi:hypothetical protein